MGLNSKIKGMKMEWLLGDISVSTVSIVVLLVYIVKRTRLAIKPVTRQKSVELFSLPCVGVEGVDVDNKGGAERVI